MTHDDEQLMRDISSQIAYCDNPNATAVLHRAADRLIELREERDNAWQAHDAAEDALRDRATAAEAREAKLRSLLRTIVTEWDLPLRDDQWLDAIGAARVALAMPAPRTRHDEKRSPPRTE